MLFRVDNKSFVVGQFRADYGKITQKQLHKSVEIQTEGYGEYLLITAVPSGYRVVYSKDRGISTGEFVHAQFGEKESFIYVESLVSDTDDALVVAVIVCGGKLYSDLLISDSESLNEELEIAVSENPGATFELIVAGSTPSVTTVEPDSAFRSPGIIVVNRALVEKETRLENRLIADYDTADNSFLLEPVSIALKKMRRSKQSRTTNGRKAIAACLLLLAAFTYYYYPGDEAIEAAPIDPFEQYKNSIQNLTSPVQHIQNAMQLLYHIETAPGWRMKSIETTDGLQGNFRVLMMNENGGLNSFVGLRETFGQFSTNFANEGFEISGGLQLRPREFPNVIYPFNEVEYKFIKQVAGEGVADVVPVGEVDYGTYHTKQFTVSLKNADPSMLMYVSSKFIDMPVVVNATRIVPTEIGYDIEISTTLFGAK